MTVLHLFDADPTNLARRLNVSATHPFTLFSGRRLGELLMYIAPLLHLFIFFFLLQQSKVWKIGITIQEISGIVKGKNEKNIKLEPFCCYISKNDDRILIIGYR